MTSGLVHELGYFKWRVVGQTDFSSSLTKSHGNKFLAAEHKTLLHAMGSD